MRFAVQALLGLVLAGCVGSTTPFRPYKGERLPEQTVQEDPIEAAVKLKYSIPHDVDEATWAVTVARRENGIVLQDTLWYEDEKGQVHRHNPWKFYETDMNRTLGPGTVREAPKIVPKSEAMLKKSEQLGEGGGGEAKPEKGEKPADGGMEKKDSGG
jgi:hypothetical protein